MTHRSAFVLAIAAAFCCSQNALAQQDPIQDLPGTQTQQDQSQNTNFRADRQRQNQNTQQETNEELVHYLAAKLMLANECQAELAGMAYEKAESPKVKQFAKSLQEEHQQLNERLKQAMPELKSVESASFVSNRSDTPLAQNDRIGDRLPGRSGVGAASNQSDPLDGAAQTLINITRRTVENNHDAIQAMLSKKQGKAFDQCYLGLEIGSHTWMVSELKAIQDNGPKEFIAIVSDAESKMQSHLEKAKQLADSMEKESGQGFGNGNPASERENAIRDN